MDFLFFFGEIHDYRSDGIVDSKEIKNEIDKLRFIGLINYHFFDTYGGTKKKILITSLGTEFYQYYTTNNKIDAYKLYWQDLMKQKGYSGNATIDDFKKIYSTKKEYLGDKDDVYILDLYNSFDDKFKEFALKFYEYETI